MIRLAEPKDLAAIIHMLQGQADHHKNTFQCKVTESQLQEAFFSQTPALYCHVADDNGTAMGCAIWLPRMEPAEGVWNMFLEDLYVLAEYRSRGVGKQLLVALTEECTRRGFASLDWQVSRYNTRAIDFYDRLGAKAQPEWINYRLTIDSLTTISHDA